jgi:hypothetical protein
MQGTKQKIPGPQQLKIGVRQTTMKKFKRIAKSNRWTLVETADAVADAFIERMTVTSGVTAGEAVASAGS